METILGFQYDLSSMQLGISVPGMLRAETLPLEKALSVSGDYGAMVASVLAGRTSPLAQPVTVVLPDCAAAADVFSLPNLGRGKLAGALAVEYEKRYRNHEELAHAELTLESNKRSVTYLMTLIRSEITQGVRRSMNELGLSPKCVTIHAAGAVAGALSLDPKNREHTFLLVDIEEAFTICALCGRASGLLSWVDLPFGTKLLEQSPLPAPETLFPHDAAAAAVQRAHLAARRDSASHSSAASDTAYAGFPEGNGTPPAYWPVIRQAAMVAASLREDSLLPVPEYILVNLPPENGSLFPVLNGMKLSDIPFLRLEAANTSLARTLSLYGAQFPELCGKNYCF